MKKSYALGHESEMMRDPFSKKKIKGRMLSPSKKGRSGKRKSARLAANRQV